MVESDKSYSEADRGIYRMKELVTGGEGYIGQNLIEHLDHPLTYDLKLGENILDRKMLNGFIRNVDQVYHLAGISGVYDCETNQVEAFNTNITGTYNVASLCREHNKPFIFTSSQAVNSKPLNFYGWTKLIGESIVQRYGGVVCRLSNVYGGKRFLDLKNTAVARLMKGTFEDRGHGEERRDFIHVNEVCKELKVYMNRAVMGVSIGSIVNIRTEKWTTINELIELSKSPDFPENIKTV